MTAKTAAKLTPKQECFAMTYVLGIDGDASTSGNGNAAYKHSYSASGMTDKVVSVEVNRLKKRPLVAGRIEALQKAKREKSEARHNVTLDKLNGMHFAAYKVALEGGNASSMTQSTQNLAKLNGFLVDKHEVDGGTIFGGISINVIKNE